jgi:mersacidin/lichenicidin family type 2 lantibiotic
MKFDIARAWKDEAYRQTLTEEELNLLPANPAGELELTDTDLETVSGGCARICPPPCLPPCPCPIGPVVFTQHSNSVALICEINIFSVNVINAAILGAVNNICTNVN